MTVLPTLAVAGRRRRREAGMDGGAGNSYSLLGTTSIYPPGVDP
jgi:hypothetical protein